MVESQPANIADTPEGDALFGEGAQCLMEQSAANSEDAGSPDSQSIQQFLRPLVKGIEALVRAQSEQAGVLGRVEKVLAGQEALPKMLTETKQAIDQKQSVSRSMFEALHSELKSYKDGFLLESVLRPVIRDMISLYDDLAEVHRQLALTLTVHEKRGDLTGGALILFENVLAPVSHLEHSCDSIIEVLERLEVTMIPTNTGKLDKRNQRAVSLEMVDCAEQDQQIVKVVKRGFQWKDRIIRAEEVVIKKWKDGTIAAPGNDADRQPAKQKSA